MEGYIQQILEEKLSDALTACVPELTRREIRLPQVTGKATAVVGMRRSGKTCFLWQCLGDRLAEGRPPASLVYLNFEDERLLGNDASVLSWILEAYFRRHPEFRTDEEVTFMFDEIQVIPGWETFCRRLLDTENVRLFLSGLSAAMLSREVASSMRGRALQTTVFPFSFREYLAHRGRLPKDRWEGLSKGARSGLEKALRDYLQEGGFPEAQGVPPRDRRSLLQSYMDVAILRDVIERHQISNPTALRWLQRHLLGNPTAPFSIQKFFDALKSQGIPVAKDTLHAFLAHFEDAFLIRTTSLFTVSERQRMVNPRKAYPVDPGLIAVYEKAGRANLGHALETAVLNELERRECTVHYVRIPDKGEIDFRAESPEGTVWLIQVCADASDPATWEREIRPLVASQKAIEADHRILLLLALPPRPIKVPEGIEVMLASPWFLHGDAVE